jgi:DNA-binding beta-propeller fold protein YncE
MPRCSSVNTTRAARRILYGAVGAALLSIPTLAIADETFIEQANVPIPASAANTTGGNLTSFDISWFDSALKTYFLADRSNNAIDVIDAATKHVRQLGVGDFAGFNASSDLAGPNGVLTLSRHGDGDNDGDDHGHGHGHGTEIWVGDGPHAGCTAALAAALSPTCSTLKILSYPSGDLLRTIPTGGVARADELCYDPADHLVMIANDADNPPFITFISTEGNNKVLGQVKIPESNGGIEQCQWNPRNGMIYLNIPSTTDDSNGKVYVIEPRHETIVAKFDATDGCGPAGMAIGPDHQILLGCGGKDALIMSDHGNILATLTGQGGNDEVWFNPGDGHYLLAESNNTVQKQLGIVDSRNAEVDQDIKTGTSSHSVAADPASNQVYVPITAAGGGSATLCSNSPTSGCVAIFGPSGPDDHPVFVSRNHD